MECSDTSELTEPKKSKRKKTKKWKICLDFCRYKAVRITALESGFEVVGQDDDWNLLWTDSSLNIDKLFSLKPHQKVNHFAGMVEICRKDFLNRNLMKMRKLFPKEYNFFPKTWNLSADFGDLQTYMSAKKGKTYIMKPDTGCQGKGIWMTKTHRDIKPLPNTMCQIYISKPLLIDGYKFDLRLYVLITFCDPLRIFLYDDGLARFCTEKYSDPTSKNMSNQYMHLTNYAINKMSDKFVVDEELGSKRHVTSTMDHLLELGYDVPKIKADINDLIIKTIISIHPNLKQNYQACFPSAECNSSCFEILGFDILITEAQKPILIEVNLSPSFHTDSPIDVKIKEALLRETYSLISIGSFKKKKPNIEERRKMQDRLSQSEIYKMNKNELVEKQKKFQLKLQVMENRRLNHFVRIYPREIDYQKYNKYFDSIGSLYKETASYKARLNCAKQMREKIAESKSKIYKKPSSRVGSNVSECSESEVIPSKKASHTPKQKNSIHSRLRAMSRVSALGIREPRAVHLFEPGSRLKSSKTQSANKYDFQNPNTLYWNLFGPKAEERYAETRNETYSRQNYVRKNMENNSLVRKMVLRTQEIQNIISESRKCGGSSYIDLNLSRPATGNRKPPLSVVATKMLLIPTEGTRVSDK